MPTPRPTIDDIPEVVDERMILLEQRQHAHDWREWRGEVNGDLAFLKRWRTAWDTGKRLMIVVIPAAAAMAAALVARA